MTCMAPGTLVKCRYRGEHQGILLAIDDPKAWVGTMAFGYGAPASGMVARHVAECQDIGMLRTSQPVEWPWGIMWDHDLIPA